MITPHIVTHPARTHTRERLILATLGVGAVGFVLNGVTLPIFGGTELIFGGWIVLLTAYTLGPWYGAMAAAIAFSRTLLTWGHPAGLICYTAEAMVTGWLVQRLRQGPLVAASLFWLLIGGPFITLFSLTIAEAPFPTNWAWMIKYPINGLLMAMVALLIFYSDRYRRFASLPANDNANTPLENVLFRRFGVIAGLSIATLSLVAGHTFDRTLREQAEAALAKDTIEAAHDLDFYLSEHKRAITVLAAKLSERPESAAAISSSLEVLRQQYPGFLTLLAADAHGVIVSAAPERNPEGQPVANSGLNVSDRDYFLTPFRTRHPYVSNVFRGRGFGGDLIIAMSAPVFDTDGQVRYIVEGSLRLTELIRAISHSDRLTNRTVVIIDRPRRVITARGRLEELPSLSSFRSETLYEAGRQAGPGIVFYYEHKGKNETHAERTIGVYQPVPSYEWRIYFAEPLWNTQSTIASYYLFTTLWGTLGIGLALILARATAREITTPLKLLVQATRNLTGHKLTDPLPELPQTSSELAEISRDLQDAALSLSRSNAKLSSAVQERDQTHRQLRQILLHLDDKVRQRTTQLDQARKFAESANHAKSEFLASMSHELRTPLNVILGMSEILREHALGPLTERQRECIDAVDESGRHLLSLINDILDLSKIEAGMLQLDIQETDVHDLCEASLRFVRESAQKKRLHLTVEHHETAATLQADSRRLKQVLVNLLANAVKFTPEGGRITLEVTQTAPDGPITFTVADTGIGIPPEHIGKLFQPFQQIDSALNRKYAGTGLGLALVRRMSEMHGGSVGVESTPGQGSRFHVTIPQGIQATPALPPAAPLTPPVIAEVCITGQPLILIAEDNPTNIQLYTGHLGPAGCRFTFAHNGLEAIERALADHPDLILMDVQMPEMDGLTATRELRADPRTTRIPIITVTALATPEDRLRCLEAGASGYLSKPVSLRELTRLIAELLQPRPGTQPPMLPPR